VCGTKKFVSVRLYSAPQSHWTIVAILRICPYGGPDQAGFVEPPGDSKANALQYPILATRQPSGFVFRGGRGPPRSLQSKNAPAALLESWRTLCREHTKAPRGWIFSDQGRCGKTADPTVCPSGSKFLVSPYKAPQDKSVPKTSALTAATTSPALPDL
jgi:hypothetical protein